MCPRGSPTPKTGESSTKPGTPIFSPSGRRETCQPTATRGEPPFYSQHEIRGPGTHLTLSRIALKETPIMKPADRSLDIAVVGLGQAGGNIAAEFHRRGYRAL